MSRSLTLIAEILRNSRVHDDTIICTKLVASTLVAAIEPITTTRLHPYSARCKNEIVILESLFKGQVFATALMDAMGHRNKPRMRELQRMLMKKLQPVVASLWKKGLVNRALEVENLYRP